MSGYDVDAVKSGEAIASVEHHVIVQRRQSVAAHDELVYRDRSTRRVEGVHPHDFNYATVYRERHLQAMLSEFNCTNFKYANGFVAVTDLQDCRLDSRAGNRSAQRQRGRVDSQLGRWRRRGVCGGDGLGHH